MRTSISKIATAILFASAATLVVRAQVPYFAINIDTQTISAISAAFAAEEAQELMTTQALDDIRKNYESSLESATGIFAVQRLKHNALKDVDIWSGEEENMYYKRIFNLVKDKIIPKTATVALACIKDPTTALYWGTELAKIVSDTQSLCQEFVSIVTNCSLSFDKIIFFKLNPDFERLINLANFNGENWEEKLTQMFKLPERPKDGDRDEMKEYIKQLAKPLINLAASSAGLDGLRDLLEKGLEYKDYANIFTGGALGDLDKYGIADGFENFNTMLNDNTGSWLDAAKGELANYLNYTGGNAEEILGKILQYGVMDGKDWTSTYANPDADKYYTRTAQIYTWVSGREDFCDYYPPLFSSGKDGTPNQYEDMKASGHYLEIRPWSTQDSPSKGSAEYNKVLAHSAEMAGGWTKERIDDLKAHDDPRVNYYYNYGLASWWYNYINGDENNVVAGWGACYIHAYRNWNYKEVVYESSVDTYNQSEEAWEKQVEAERDKWNQRAKYEYNVTDKIVQSDNTDPNNPSTLDKVKNPLYGQTFYIYWGSKNSYEKANADKLKGATHVSINVTCHDHANVQLGECVYKCSDHDDSLDEDGGQCALGGNDEQAKREQDMQKLQDQIASCQQSLEATNKEISSVQSQMYALNLKYSNHEITSDEYVEQYAVLNEKKKQLQDQANRYQSAINQSNEALTDMQTTYVSGTGEKIKDYESEAQMMFSIRWSGQGKYERQPDGSYLYSRVGQMKDGSAAAGSTGGKTITFKAEVTVKEEAVYFIFRIHRSRNRIKAYIETDGDNATTLEQIEFSADESETSKEATVNQKLQSWREVYPDCDVSYVVDYTNDSVNPEDDDVPHLLYSSDRLAIARHIEARLLHIYGRLVTLEKFMSYRRTLLDWLIDEGKKLVRLDVGKKKTLTDEVLQRWRAMSHEGWSYTSGSPWGKGEIKDATLSGYIDQRKKKKQQASN